MSSRPRRKSKETATLDQRPRSAPSDEVKARGANATADRAIEILLLFSIDRPTWSTGEIAAHFGMPLSTTYRYLGSLRAHALIVEDEQGGFRLGPRVLPMARIARSGTPILALAMTELVALNEAFGEAVTLYERVGTDSIPVETLESRHRVRLLYQRGNILPWPGAASAKVLLAYAPRDEQDAIFRMLAPEPYTENTVTSPNALRRTLKQIVGDGYAYSDQEREQGIRAIAAPVFSDGEARYCVTMSGPIFRMTDEKIPRIISTVCDVAKAISANLADAEF